MTLTADAEVPPAFREAGFSGFFHLDAVAEAPRLWRRMVPCLIGNSGWMALRVNDNDSVTLVRRDVVALGDVLLRAPGSIAAPRVVMPLRVNEWIAAPRFHLAHLFRSYDPITSAFDATLCGKAVRGRVTRASSLMTRCRICAQRFESRRAA